MNIMFYGSEQEYVIVNQQLTSHHVFCYRKTRCILSETYDHFIHSLNDGVFDVILVAADGAAGREGVIAAKNLCPETPVCWLSDDKEFGTQSYRLECAYFGVKPITEAMLHNILAVAS